MIVDRFDDETLQEHGDRTIDAAFHFLVQQMQEEAKGEKSEVGFTINLIMKVPNHSPNLLKLQQNLLEK